LTSLHIQPVAYRTCANRPASGDFMSVMRENVQSVMQAAQNPSRAKPPFQKRR